MVRVNHGWLGNSQKANFNEVGARRMGIGKSVQGNRALNAALVLNAPDHRRLYLGESKEINVTKTRYRGVNGI